MRLILRTLINEVFELDVEPSDTIFSVKDKVQERLGILKLSQRLVLKDMQLNTLRSLFDWETLAEIEIRPEARLYVIPAMRFHVDFQFRLPSGQELKLTVTAVPFWRVKALIQERTGFASESLRIQFEGREIGSEEMTDQILIKPTSPPFIVSYVGV